MFNNRETANQSYSREERNNYNKGHLQTPIVRPIVINIKEKSMNWTYKIFNYFKHYISPHEKTPIGNPTGASPKGLCLFELLSATADFKKTFGHAKNLSSDEHNQWCTKKCISCNYVNRTGKTGSKK